MTIKAIVFDLDGTLIHSALDLHYAANEMLRALGRAPLDLATVISFIGNGVPKLVVRCLEATDGATADVEAQARALFMQTYSANMTRHTVLYPGVRTALDDFAERGIAMGVCTNKPTAPAQAICDALDLSRYFKIILGAGPEHPRKPDSAPLLACLAALECRPDQSVYVGDSRVDYETSRNANVPFKLFTSGYLKGALPSLAKADRFDDWQAHSIL